MCRGRLCDRSKYDCAHKVWDLLFEYWRRCSIVRAFPLLSKQARSWMMRVLDDACACTGGALVGLTLSCVNACQVDEL